jgi:hypothetical protein
MKKNILKKWYFYLILIMFFGIIFTNYSQITGMAGGGANCEDAAWEVCELSCSGANIAYPAGGSCVDPDLCCRTPNYCGDTFVDPSEDCDGADLDGNACTDLGFYGGTLACSSCSFDNSSCTGYCGDGTCDAGEETCGGCNSDCNGTQADCSNNYICSAGSCIVSSCEDNTSASTCVVNSTPSYCDSNGTLVNNCTACACSGGYSCQGDGSCLLDVVTSDSTYSGKLFKVKDAIITESEIKFDTDVRITISSLIWEGLRRNDRIVFEVKMGDVTEEHKIEVERVSRYNGYVDIIIESEAMEIRVYENETKNIDLNKDGIDDVSITITNIGEDDFDINLEECFDQGFKSCEIMGVNDSFDNILVVFLIGIFLGGFSYYYFRIRK